MAQMNLNSNDFNAQDWKQSYYCDVEHSKTDTQVVKSFVDDILKLAEARTGIPRAKMKVLDVGCGPGQYTAELANQVEFVFAAEPYEASYQEAQRLNSTRQNVQLYFGPIESAPIKNESFDLAISLTTVEHMPNARLSMEQVMGALKAGGILYLTAPNKLWPIECHYHLPFLSWLPLPFANLYLRLMQKGTSYKSCSYSRTYWGMKRLFAGMDCRLEFLVPDENATYIGCGNTQSHAAQLVKLWGIRAIRRFPFLWTISKGFVILISKEK